MTETIKAADAKIGKWYWVYDQPWLCVINDGWGGTVRFYRPREPDYDLDTDDEIIPLPDDAGYDYELPPPEPDYAELHAKCGLKVGDRVRVTSKTEPNGWRYTWTTIKDSIIGERGVINAGSGGNGFHFVLDKPVGSLIAAWLPCTSLEKIEPEYRPFANAAEFEPHEGRRWRYVSDLSSQRRMTTGYNDDMHHADSWDICFKQKVFCDGQPFGVEVTQ